MRGELPENERNVARDDDEAIYEALEEQGVKCAIRIPANDSLEPDIAELLTRPVGRPGTRPASLPFLKSLYSL